MKVSEHATGTGALRTAILGEQVHAYYRTNVWALITALGIVPTLLVIGFSGALNSALLYGWLAGMYAVAAARVMLAAAYLRRRPPADEARKWANAAIVGTLISGSLWGAAGVLLFVPDVVRDQLLLLLVLACVGAGAVVALSAILPAFYGYLLTSFSPVLLALFRVGDRVHMVLALLVVVYAAALSYFALVVNRILTESLRLRFEQVELLKEMTRKKEEAERANLGKSRFLAAASHDLRQPLHALGLFVSALEGRLRQGSEHVLIGHIRASLQALEDLLNSLLDVSRLDAGTVIPRIADCPLQPLFDRLRNESVPVAQAKNLRFRVRTTKLAVATDALLLERILRNLLANAIRYTKQGGVLLAARRRGSSVWVEVWDTGIGIKPEHQRDIFEEFFQVGNEARDRTKGLGLGLAIVQRLCRLLNHRLELVSQVGRGSRFRVEMPARAAMPVATGAPSPARIGFEDALVAVVEDDVVVLNAIRTLLAQWGCRIAGGTHADEVLAALGKEAPEVILADYRLADGVTGTDVVRRIREHFHLPIPALLVTGDTSVSRLRDATASGLMILHKPV
ncbi:MAG: ATP-binding protein, partial [Acidiferrobacteraceae bacterium]